MGPYEDLFREPQSVRPLGDDFESRVLGKISRKKQQRKQATFMVLGLGLALVLGLWLVKPDSVPARKSGPLLAAQVTMEEIPLVEEITFTASGQQVEYPLELVSLTASEGGM